MVSKVLLIAGTTKDYVNNVLRIGGSAFYALTSLTHLGVEATVITNTSYLMKVCRRYGLHKIITPNPEFNIVYEITLPKGMGERDLRLKTPVRTLSEKVMDVLNDDSEDADAVLISPVAQEVTISDILAVVNRYDNVVVDIQGIVRRFDSEGRMSIDPGVSREVISKLRRYDLIIRGEISEFPPECRGPALVKCVEGFRAKAIQTMGEGPIYIAYPDGKLCIANALSHAYGDDIGAGDVFSSVLVAYLPSHDLLEAVAVATAASFLRIARSRLPWFSPHEIRVIGEKVLDRMRCLH